MQCTRDLLISGIELKIKQQNRIFFHISRETDAFIFNYLRLIFSGAGQTHENIQPNMSINLVFGIFIGRHVIGLRVFFSGAYRHPNDTVTSGCGW